MKKVFICFILVICLLMSGCGKEEKRKEDLLGIDFSTSENKVELSKYDTKNPLAALYIEDYGAVVIELYPEIAKNTVNNFISLIQSGFYDGNTFHRLIPGFVLQGGDPTGTGSGGCGYTIKGEFSNNGVENSLKHEKGIVSMARSMENDSAGSQFFIMLGDAPHLDGSYASFGKVIDGMENVERIEEEAVVEDSESGKLAHNLTLKKALVDLRDYDFKEVEKISEE